MATINTEYIQRLNALFQNGNTSEMRHAVNEIERIRVIASAFNVAHITPERHANNIKSCWAAINETSREYVAIGNEILTTYDGQNIDLDKMYQFFNASDKVFGAWKSLISYLKHNHLDDEDNICFDIIEAVHYVAECHNDESRVYYLIRSFIKHNYPIDI